jgi:RHS repeat-associated protein
VYALQDGNWNTTALIAAAGVPGKATGDLIQRMVYNPYGEVFLLNPDWTEQLGTPLVPWQHLFQGLKFTEATGLGYVRNRDYSPTLGRFIMLDPIGFSAGDNNWYRFVGNGPLGRLDPSGLAHRKEQGQNCPDTQTEQCEADAARRLVIDEIACSGLLVLCISLSGGVATPACVAAFLSCKAAALAKFSWAIAACKEV